MKRPPCPLKWTKSCPSSNASRIRTLGMALSFSFASGKTLRAPRPRGATSFERTSLNRLIASVPFVIQTPRRRHGPTGGFRA